MKIDANRINILLNRMQKRQEREEEERIKTIRRNKLDNWQLNEKELFEEDMIWGDRIDEREHISMHQDTNRNQYDRFGNKI